MLSGPSFAADVARGLPAAVTIATADEALGEQLATALGYRNLRIYWSGDLIGVQLGGALKNVLAIAAGIVHGRGARRQRPCRAGRRAASPSCAASGARSARSRRR